MNVPDKPAGVLSARRQRGEAQRCHRGRDGGMGYVLHFTGVTSSGVPFLELIQPVAVRRHGHCSV
jgi:hypothetical protein